MSKSYKRRDLWEGDHSRRDLRDKGRLYSRERAHARHIARIEKYDKRAQRKDHD